MRVIKPNKNPDNANLSPGDGSKTLLIYGETQSGKTSLLGEIARAHFEKTGKRTRLIMTDEGGTSAIDPYIQDGIIEVVSLVGDSLPQSNLMWLAKGKWPGADGKIDPKVEFPEDIGIIALDSLSSAAELVLGFFVQSGLKVAQDVVALREEQGLKFGNAAPAHYGNVQKFILQMMTQLASLPVDRVIYTALESKAEDTIDKSVILGPMIAGKALTGVIPSRINRTLHLEITPSADRKSRSYRIYFKPHVDTTLGKMWPANLRLPLALTAQMSQHPVYGKGYIDFSTGEELLELFAYCQNLLRGRGDAEAGAKAAEPSEPVKSTPSTTKPTGLKVSGGKPSTT